MSFINPIRHHVRRRKQYLGPEFSDAVQFVGAKQDWQTCLSRPPAIFKLCSNQRSLSVLIQMEGFTLGELLGTAN